MTLTDLFRILALVLLAMATGGMVRLYLSQSKMPWLAFLAVVSATVSMASTIIFKIVQTPDTGFRPWVTPPVILYSVFILIALRKFLSLRVRRQNEMSKNAFTKNIETDLKKFVSHLGHHSWTVLYIAVVVTILLIEAFISSN